ncbi:MAG: amidophosphoribosyltransferase [Candidatus Theseobacter exili]|nr:amidophosphoribosyltransferase [Candidatus Theseobacter exili]
MNNRTSDKPVEYCGVFGVYGHRDAAWLTYLGLYSLQHRGQESAGIVTSKKGDMYSYKGMGLVSKIFKPSVLNGLEGKLAIGHVRYSTTGSNLNENSQPLLVSTARGNVAIGHNGNLVNANRLRAELEKRGSIFQTSVDSEIILHFMAQSLANSNLDALIDGLRMVKGAFSLVVHWKDQIIGVRDPYGFRPLSLGKIDNAFVLASESCALDIIGAEFIRDVEPGELVVLDKNGVKSHHPFAKPDRLASCVFEHVYFARPDSNVFGDSVHAVRKKFGRMLAKEHPADADMVIPVPDSGTSAALGFAEESGIPYDIGFVRNHYIGRTFIQPTQEMRNAATTLKLNPLRSSIKGKRLVVVDDSIVRGTTSRSRIKLLREAGASEIHMRISCPPHKYPCYFGIDFPSSKELLAKNHSIEEIAKFLGADTIGYLSCEGMLNSLSQNPENYCTACFTGEYPVKIKAPVGKLLIERRMKKIVIQG